jgi:hypothetical protein
MSFAQLGSAHVVMYPLTRPLAIVHFARPLEAHRAGCCPYHRATIYNLLILLGFILLKTWHALCNTSPKSVMNE